MQTTPNSNSNTSEPLYAVGEKFLCYHGALIYEAKCLQVEKHEFSNEYMYYVHYNGWSKNWDEWVKKERIMKYNAENLKKQKDLVSRGRYSANSNSNNNFSICANAQTPNSISPVSSNKRLKTSNAKEEENSENCEENETKKNMEEVKTQIKKEINEFKIIFPESLKNWLLDDFDYINNQNKLIKLPCRKPLASILTDYVAHKLDECDAAESKKAKTIKDVVKSIINYFNAMLGSQLLYKFERIQYDEMLKTKKNMSDIYGAMHSLRLFEKFKEVIAAQNETPYLEILVYYANDYLKYLDKLNESLFSSEDYILVPPYYVRGSI